MKYNKYIAGIAALGLAAGLAVVSPAFAQTPPSSTSTTSQWGGRGGMHGDMMHGGMPPGVFGTVSSLSGTTLTVTAGTRPNATTTVAIIYTVDASNAKVFKDGTSSALSSVATGDKVMVEGTLSGTNVVATAIRDGFGEKGMMGMGRGREFGKDASSTPPTLPIQGDGQPVVAGSVTATNGSTLTVTNASNITYTVDASNAKIVKAGVTATISAVATGDNVVVQGAVNGTSITASSVLDQGTAQGNGGSASSTVHSAGQSFGFFGAIGSFFKHLFGF